MARATSPARSAGGSVRSYLGTYPTDPALSRYGDADTYVGDGATLHKIKGSPYGTASNVFRIEGPGINPSPTVDACPTVTGPIADCIETDLFTVQGKLATTSGVTAEQATYSRSSAGAGNVDVYASSETGPQAIQVSDAASVPRVRYHRPRRQQRSLLRPSCLLRCPTTGEGSGSNTGDVPVSTKLIDVVDRVTGSATYDTDSQIRRSTPSPVTPPSRGR